MIEKVGHIKNPLTIIAMFAAIAEISGTAVLPFIHESNQSIYVWFLIIFPVLLIALFFLTLNFNHRVLYAPSDYQNEDNFLHSLPRASFTEKVEKIQAELAEAQSESEAPDLTGDGQSASSATTPPTPIKPDISYQTLVRRSSQASYMLAEELIFRKLSNEFTPTIQREVKLGTLGGRYIFDGIVRDKGVTTIIEVKYARNGFMSSMHFKETMSRIQEAAKLLPNEQTSNLRVLLAIATDEVSTSRGRIESIIERLRGESPFPIEVRFYSLADLEREFNIQA
ncbi:hypothetical protein [Stutzerimonas stutzeri]|uniref:hypothetical protein n=1 Tax=Stutzerimonas stutzeri TaxID=316 RepID=UPI00190AF55E|nr:hypothetical protein [Stutzerimonas stutzeri]